MSNSDREKSEVEVQSTNVQQQPSEFTWRSCMATAGAALAYFVSVGFLNAFGVFQEYYSSVVLRSKTDFQISWLGSFAPAAGVLADKYGPTVPLAGGSICVLLAVFMVSLSKNYWQLFLTQGLLMGVGMSFIAIPASGMVPRYFKRNRGLVSGISVAGSSLGGVIWPIVAEQLFLKRHLSFGWSIRVIGFIMLPLLVIVVLTVRPPIKKPEPRSDPVADVQTSKKGEGGKKLVELRQPAFILLCAGLAVSSLGFFSPFFYVSTYAVQLGMSESLAFYLVSTVNAASLFGRVLPGIVADRWGRFNILIASAWAGGIVAFCWTAARNVPGIFVWTAVHGFTSGAILSLQLACATTLISEESAGAAVGIAMGCMSFSQLIGPPITGILSKHGFLGVSMFTGSLLVAGGVLILGARLCLSRDLSASV